ncbi:MAG TPA: RNA polymerase sigma factor [Gammaproteobacteria bacterium]|nr:RNA polymerase sigma factor [Gammaproteobacteria bacterium]
MWRDTTVPGSPAGPPGDPQAGQGHEQAASAANHWVRQEDRERVLNDASHKQAELPETLDEFLAGVERRAFQMARVATRDNEEALDIVQDAMIQLVQRYGQRAAEEWAPLFYRILQNRIRDWYRRQQVRNRWRVWFKWGDDEDGRDLEDMPQTVEHTPDGQLEKGRMLNQVEAALHQLPLRQQQVFLMRAVEGLDVAETAESLGISGGSVKTHYSRAVKRLRETLGGVL